jgi:hypothetical protein
MRLNARAKTVGKTLLTTFVATGVLACLTFLAASRANAQAPQAGSPSGASEKVDVTDLEKKYWASKDTDFSVVQNRVYSKAFMLESGDELAQRRNQSENADSMPCTRPFCAGGGTTGSRRGKD